MKNYLLLITCTLMCSMYSFAQTNLGFEAWSNTGVSEDPTDWLTTNLFSALGANVSCVKTTPHWGTHAMGLCPATIPGLGTISGFAIQQYYYTKRPKSVSLYYKYNSNANDSAMFSILFSKGPTGDSTNPIGEANIMLPKATKWTLMKTDIIWQNATVPDSATIMISNSQSNATDTLFVDDIGISMYGVPVNHILNPALKVYFNASNNDLMLDPTLLSTNCHVIIRNTIGQTVFEGETKTGSVNLTNLPQGVYVYEIHSEKDELMSGKFIR